MNSGLNNQFILDAADFVLKNKSLKFGIYVLFATNGDSNGYSLLTYLYKPYNDLSRNSSLFHH